MPNPAHNDCTKFEQVFAHWLGTPYAFAFWKGRVALYALLHALGIGPHDEVILPGYTCVMDVNPIKYLGAQPVYVDIEPITYNINVDLLEKKITPHTKAIIAQHTYGYPCALDAIMDISRRHGIPVVEDCCLALGSKYQQKKVGTFGLAAYFSFQWNKSFTTGVGGMATTSDRALAEKIETLCREKSSPPPYPSTFMLTLQRLIYRAFIFPRTTALATSLFRRLTQKGLVVGSSSAAEFVPQMPENFFLSMGPAQARAGLRQMKKIEANFAHRKYMKTLYDNLLKQAGWPVADIPSHFDPVLVRYPLRVCDKNKVLTQAPSHLVEIGSWFECPLHPLETPLPLYDYHPGMCPVAQKACAEVVNLPLHPRANEKTAIKTIRFINKYIPLL